MNTFDREQIDSELTLPDHVERWIRVTDSGLSAAWDDALNRLVTTRNTIIAEHADAQAHYARQINREETTTGGTQ